MAKKRKKNAETPMLRVTRRALGVFLASTLTAGMVPAAAFAAGEADAGFGEGGWRFGGAIPEIAPDPDLPKTNDAGFGEGGWRYADSSISMRIENTFVFPNTLETLEAEQNKWTRTSKGWETVRGGSKMTVTNAQAFGIDVSEWQRSIDWAAAKADGVQFAILRCGFGRADTGRMDRYFIQNVQGCKENGIPFGIYLYSYATEPGHGVLEAQHVLSLLAQARVKPSDLSFPVYYDLEDGNQRDMDSVERGDLAEGFCNTIAAAGYTPGIYGNQYWFNNYLDDPRFENWTKWVASYPRTGQENAATTYTGTYDMWQCMSSGVIDGIDGSVDINFSYGIHVPEAPAVTTPSTPTTEKPSTTKPSTTKPANSTKFDSAIYKYDYYLEKNPDVKRGVGTDPTAVYAHFVNYGMREGRTSHPDFDVQSYYNANGDLRRAFGFDVAQYYTHYLQNGQNEHRTATGATKGITDPFATAFNMNYSSVFDPSYYANKYSDLKAIYGKNNGRVIMYDDKGLLEHYLLFGKDEGRSPSEKFDIVGYYNQNPDVRAVYGEDVNMLLNHYINHGQYENRAAKATNKMVGAVSVSGGRDYSPVYDAGTYAGNYPDLKSAFSSTVGSMVFLDDKALFDHFLKHGMAEGRVASDSFDVSAYRANNPDLASAFGKDTKLYYVHYIDTGKDEGRIAK